MLSSLLTDFVVELAVDGVIVQ